MQRKDFAKIQFAQKYGTESHKARADTKIDAMANSGKTEDAVLLANSSDLSLKSSHVHSILDHKPEEGWPRHPAVNLSKWHFGDLKDEHWDKLARHPDSETVLATLPHAPQKHVKTIATTHTDPFVRGLAANHYMRRKAAGVPD